MLEMGEWDCAIRSVVLWLKSDKEYHFDLWFCAVWLFY